MLNLHGEIILVLAEAAYDGRLTMNQVADRIIVLLDKKVQEAGWRVDGPSGLMSVEVIGNDSPATFEDVISGKAVRR
jgi:hypothetical protein